MGRKKHLRLEEVKHLPNVLHTPFEPREKYFKNSLPVTLELGCGKGEYVLALAQKYPERNFIGIDKKADRLWYGAQKALALNLPNVLFMRLPIEKLAEYFGAQSIAEIWLTFPDPFARRDEAKKRLVAKHFQDSYQKVLIPKGVMHLKTDNEQLFAYAQSILESLPANVLQCLPNVYSLDPVPDYLLVQTTFERKYLQIGKKIMYISWQF
ncbi:MAG: tRNA (guanosine(46)-N7)-methyltransferase TrmB [Candidatus Abawacabacteria bacterium]|nr:tRNA (guanosine(46)-N7)-methyltransferase TrmB [Candidatus Abawacabacteria bacterium]